MELVKKIEIPIIADRVLTPDVYYGNDITAICFQTEDDQFGRITFQHLDAIKVCRGEMLPYKYSWKNHKSGNWVFKIQNSKWQIERFKYERKHYGSSYEFGGDVNEMLTNFNHYLFSFHDQFVEVIAKGFWFEKAEKSLFKKPLQTGHPFLHLPETVTEIFEVAGLKYKVIFNPIAVEQLVKDIQYCEQKLLEIVVDFKEKNLVQYELILMQRQGKLISCLNKPFFPKPIFEKEGLATFNDIIPLIGK